MSNQIIVKLKDDESYEHIIKDIINDDDFNKLCEIKHHEATNRYTHSLRVSYYSYIIAKKLNLDYFTAARSGLLHDFYYENPSDQDSIKEKSYLMLSGHAKIAALNAKNKFAISVKEEDAIRSHMFPFSKIPKYKESWIVMLADKYASAGEFSHRCNYACMFALVLLLNWFYQ